jgi:hypothetical protein
MICKATKSHEHCFHSRFDNSDIERCCHCGRWNIAHKGNLIPLPRLTRPVIHEFTVPSFPLLQFRERFKAS